MQLKNSLVKFRTIAVLTAILVMGPVFLKQAITAPRNIGKGELQQLKSGEIPKNATKEIRGGMFSKNSYFIELFTPRAQAAIYANNAKDNYMKLDSTNFKTAMFNRFVEISVSNMYTSQFNASSPEPKELRIVSRVVLVIEDEFFEADSVSLRETNYSNAYGADYKNVDGSFYFSLYLFDGLEDIKIVVFDDQGKTTKKLKHKNVNKLE